MKQTFIVEIEYITQNDSCCIWAVENAIKEIIRPYNVTVR